ncbi:ABC transporter substrate-binding protein [uncultured Pseudokineococcus sp.]|uniref:ABC transporter substrate-binding protein n=1 Tax=uncultured Pseudokineococcus sp. TaxID=1642928 RepID=UPI002635A07E|nr:ABC transporter substrate-binding protein [uncultured Pseudokineococcus sp.]
MSPTRTSTRRGRLATATGLGLAATLVVSGCTGAQAPQGAEGAEGGGQGEGTMLFAGDAGSPTFTRNFNPYNSTNRKGAFHIYEPLTVLNTVDGESTPFLASSVEQVDAQTVVFTLREDATWTDGEPFTADDVTFTFDLLREHPALDLDGVWQRLESVEADGTQVTMRFAQPDVPATDIIGGTVIVPEHLWADVEDPVSFANEEPVGTGPFALGDFGPNQYTLVKNQEYWQADAVAADELVIPASNEQLDLVNNGYDWAYAFIEDVEGTWVSANEGNTYWFPPGGTISLLPNLTQAPFDDVDFRRGLSLALDREAVADAAASGYTDAAPQSGLILPGQQELLDEEVPDEGRVAQDADAALEAFAAAGYTQEGGQLVGPDGQQATIAITTANGYTDWLRGVQEVQRQLQALGIAVTIEQPQPAAYQQAVDNGDFQLAMGGFGGTGSFYRDMNQLLNSEFAEPVGTTAASNYQRFSDPEVDELLGRYQAAVDPAEQEELAGELQQVMYDQVPVIAMYYGGLWGLFSDAKFTGWPSEEDPYATPITYDSNVLLIDTNLERAGS